MTPGRALSLVALTTFALLLAVSGLAQVTDPFLRHDDYPALLRLGDLFYEKTLSEGRWINYWWHLRPFDTPAWLNYALYLLGWAVFAAAISLHALVNAPTRFAVLAAALIAMSPQATLISLWFNTLLPGMWIVAIYAAITLWLPVRTSRALLLVFVPLSLLTYSTHPFLLLAVCLVRQDQARSLRDLIGLLVLFAVSIALGLTLIYSLNYAAHGVFGIALSDWREASPATSIDSYLANLPKVLDFLLWAAEAMGFNDPALSIVINALFLGALVMLALKRPTEALYILAGIGAGLGLLCLHALQEGVLIPVRATLFLWVLFAIALTRAAALVAVRSPRAASLANVVLILTVLTAAPLVWRHYASLGDWQHTTLELAQSIPMEATTIEVHGPAMTLPGAEAAGIQHPLALAFRLARLTGTPTVSCDEGPAACDSSGGTEPGVRLIGDKALLQLAPARP